MAPHSVPYTISQVCVTLGVTGILLDCFFLLDCLLDFQQGAMDTWMAWANEDPSKLSCKLTCLVHLGEQ